ncbi:hypothetical protein [Bordetella sp. BOR01]|uniref:hypothetical protein n=1 Tax=Bordetella sp. BOR01 TaxID=2854779 RepID=UPI001C44CEF7|nr:hypothetical protein [Bordetella sp. BOR01]MBV7482859.1 hypothetical protein [Bordetella sp. BOR01]
MNRPGTPRQVSERFERGVEQPPGAGGQRHCHGQCAAVRYFPATTSDALTRHGKPED